MYFQLPSSQSKKQPKNDLISSVQRALHLLELLASHPAGLTAKQVAAAASCTLQILSYIRPTDPGLTSQ